MTISKIENQRLVYGVGITDESTRVDKTPTKSYELWKAMLARCYSDYFHNLRPTYKDCEVCEEWKTYSNFKKWFDENYVEGFVLDKDLKNPGNKIYSPENCEFVPPFLNTLMSDKSNSTTGFKGVYQGYKGSYNAMIRINGKNRHLGTFKRARDAFNAYKAEKEAVIRSVAMKYFIIDNVISADMFKALMQYEIKPEGGAEIKSLKAA